MVLSLGKARELQDANHGHTKAITLEKSNHLRMSVLHSPQLCLLIKSPVTKR